MCQCLDWFQKKEQSQQQTFCELISILKDFDYMENNSWQVSIRILAALRGGYILVQMLSYSKESETYEGFRKDWCSLISQC